MNLIDRLRKSLNPQQGMPAYGAYQANGNLGLAPPGQGGGLNLFDLLGGGSQNQVDPAQAPPIMGGGGIVATPEQEAESARLEQQLFGGQPAPEVQDNPIVVQGYVPPPLDPRRYSMPTGSPNLDNTDFLIAARKAEQTQKEQLKKEGLERKGMFGMKGTLRDVVGMLGDAFLVQSGNAPVYAPQRQKERAADAMAGQTANPLAAVERMTQVDPSASWQMHEKVMANQIAEAQAQAAALKAQQENYEKGANFFAQRIYGAENEEGYQRIRPMLLEAKRRFGLGDEFQVPEKYDEVLAQTMGRGAMKTDRQEVVQQGNRRLDITERQGDARIGVAQQNADANTTRANRPPAGRAEPNPTMATIVNEIRAKVNRGEKLSPGDAQIWSAQTKGKSGGRSGRSERRQVTPPRFR